MKNKKVPATLQGLDRALELLEILAKNGAGMNISEVSKALNITRVTASNMIHSLLQRNFIEKDPVTGKFFLGYKLFDLAQMYRYRYPFLYAAEEHVRNFSDKLQVRINVCVLKSPGVAVVLLSKDESLLPKMILGYVMPAHTSASGKVLMAFAPQEVATEWLKNMEPTRYTPHTVTDKALFADELTGVRKHAIAYECEEMMLQRCCVAAPIRDMSGQVIASVSFSVDKERMDKDGAMLEQNIRLLAKMISSSLGYNALLNP